VPSSPGMPRTIPLRVRVVSPRHRMVLDATFKTGGAFAAADPD